MQQLTPEQILKPYQTTHDSGGRIHHLVTVEDAIKAMQEYAQQLPSPDKTAEERAKELWPFEINDSVHNEEQCKRRAAYLTGYKEALQQPVFLWVEVEPKEAGTYICRIGLRDNTSYVTELEWMPGWDNLPNDHVVLKHLSPIK